MKLTEKRASFLLEVISVTIIRKIPCLTLISLCILMGFSEHLFACILLALLLGIIPNHLGMKRRGAQLYGLYTKLTFDVNGFVENE